MRFTDFKAVAWTLGALGAVGFLANVKADTIYVSHTAASGPGKISEVSSSGVVTTFASGGGLTATSGLAFDSSGNLYAANLYGASQSNPGSIIEITPGGTQSVFASGFANQPEGLAFDSSGNLYAANNANGTISEITPGGSVSTFASLPNNVTGLAFDSSGNLYVADTQNTIKKITPGGTVTTFATVTGFPYGLAFDSSGNLYSADFSTNAIDKITPGGSVSTIAMGLDGPTGLAFASNGDLYAANQDGSVSQIDSSGNVTPFATGAGGGWIADPIPEPSMLGLLAVVGVGLLTRRCRVGVVQ